MDPQYGDILTDHFTHPRNVGALDKSSPRVGTGIVGTEDCGDVIRLQIEAGDDGRIVEARFKTFGCAPAIAASSWTTEWLKGRTIGQAELLDRSYVADELSLPPAKLHCSALAERAVKAAVADWKGKDRSAGEALSLAAAVASGGGGGTCPRTDRPCQTGCTTPEGGDHADHAD
jgi:nitrogen fixation protein NifU and related proteins